MCAPSFLPERGRGQRASEEVPAGGLVLALTREADLVPAALLVQLFGASGPQR